MRVFKTSVKFGPNMFGMFQKKGIGFKQIQRKKRLDRVLQLACVGTFLTRVGMFVKALILVVAKASGKSPAVVSLVALLGGILWAAARKAVSGKKVDPVTA